MLGFDYAWGRPSPAELKAAGGKFVCRYLSPDPTKNIDKAEAAALRRAGLEIVLVWESTRNRALAGRDAGIADARAAAHQASAIGAPATLPIYFAVDFDAQPAQLATVKAYFSGAASVLGKQRVGSYGGYHVVKALLDAGSISWAWQTLAWSYGNWDPRAHIRQTGGRIIDKVKCDVNEAMRAPFGSWPVVVPAKPQPPFTVTGPRGGLITRGTIGKVARLLPGLLRRFRRIGVRRT